MSTTAQATTAEELFRLPDDGFRYELVKGELRKMAPAGSEHGAIIARLTIALGQYIEANNLGELFGAETGFKITSNPDTVRAPDIAFIRRERIPETGIPKEYWPGPPDLAVEVLSPSDTFYEVEEKIEQYLATGVSVVWVINPKKRTVTIHRPQSEAKTLAENDTLDGQNVAPGFQYNIARMFASRR